VWAVPNCLVDVCFKDRLGTFFDRLASHSEHMAECGGTRKLVDGMWRQFDLVFQPYLVIFESLSPVVGVAGGFMVVMRSS
jgi:hypothetical protein